MLYMLAQSPQLCPILCNSMDCSLPGSSDNGILQTRVLEWAAMPSPGHRPDPGIEPASLPPALAGRLFTTCATWEPCLILGLDSAENQKTHRIMTTCHRTEGVFFLIQKSGAPRSLRRTQAPPSSLLCPPVFQRPHGQDVLQDASRHIPIPGSGREARKDGGISHACTACLLSFKLSCLLNLNFKFKLSCLLYFQKLLHDTFVYVGLVKTTETKTSSLFLGTLKLSCKWRVLLLGKTKEWARNRQVGVFAPVLSAVGQGKAERHCFPHRQWEGAFLAWTFARVKEMPSNCSRKENSFCFKLPFVDNLMYIQRNARFFMIII